MEDHQDEEAGSRPHDLPLRGTGNTGPVAGLKLHDLPLRGTGNTEPMAGLRLQDPPLRSTGNTGSKSKMTTSHPRVFDLPFRGINNSRSEAGSRVQGLPLRGADSSGLKRKDTVSHPHVLNLPIRGTNNSGSMREETISYPHVFGLPLRGTNSTGFKREETIPHPQMYNLPLRSTGMAGSKSKENISHPHVHNLPLRGTDSTGSESKQTILHPHMQGLPLRGPSIAGLKSESISYPCMHGLPPLQSSNIAGANSEQTISQARMHNLPLRGPNVAGSKSKQTIPHPHNPTNHATGKFSPDSQNETAAPAAGVKRHNAQGTSAPPLTWSDQGYRAEGTGITPHGQQALPTYSIVDENNNVIQAGIVLERTDPSSDRRGRWRVAKIVPSATSSSSVEQFAIGRPSAFRVGGRSEVDAAPAPSSATVGQPAPAATFSAHVEQHAPDNTFSAPVEQPAPAPASTFSAAVEQPKTHPSTSHANGSREADPSPAATFSAPVKQPAFKQPGVKQPGVKQRGGKVRAIFALKLFTSDSNGIPCRTFHLPPGSIELHSTPAAANAEARRVAGSLLSSGQISEEKTRKLQKEFDQKLQDLKQGVSGEGDEAKGHHVNEESGFRVTWVPTSSTLACWHSVFHSGIGVSDFPGGFLPPWFMYVGYRLELCVVALTVDAPAVASLFSPY